MYRDGISRLAPRQCRAVPVTPLAAPSSCKGILKRWETAAAGGTLRPGEGRMEDRIINNRAMSRYELPIDAESAAFAYYAEEDGRVVLRHTEVPFEHGGRGYGTRLAHALFELLLAEGKRVIAKCPFMARYAASNPRYAAMLDG
jgi:predicted GNAT family acetyltransferase